jgi:hypothetical protein
VKNMTITAEPDVLRWARMKAAEEDASVSHFIGQLLKERMLRERGYAAARREHFAALKPARFQNAHTFSRDELHDRAALRRAK